MLLALIVFAISIGYALHLWELRVRDTVVVNFSQVGAAWELLAIGR